MPERQKRLGDSFTENVLALFEKIGWNQKGCKNVDIPCTLSTHTDRESPHGIDAFFTYDDPYRNLKRGVILEAKNWSWDRINSSSIEDSIKQTLQTLECAPESEDFKEKLGFNDLDLINSAVLAMWGHDDFNQESFNEYVKEIEIPRKKRKAYQIILAGNYQIEKILDTISVVRELREESEGEESAVDFFHPGHSDNDPVWNDTLTIEEIMSKFIFTRVNKRDEYGTVTNQKIIPVILFFDKITFENLNFMYKASRDFQLNDEEELIIYSNNTSPDKESIIEEFKRSGLPSGGKDIEIEFRTMPSLRLDAIRR